MIDMTLEYIGSYGFDGEPTLTDKEIVRCRDCLKWDHDSPYPKKACFEFSNPEDGYIVMTSSDGFCALPERRTE